MKKPLFRKVNTKARGVRHQFGGDFRNDRRAEPWEMPGMARGVRRGLDYTPLFRFLLSRVGEPWDATHREAVERLDTPDPIFWLVALTPETRRDIVRIGESSYYSGLYVDDDSLLQRVAPGIGPGDLEPSCGCCTHTLNGVPFTRKYSVP
jgi:hypothetical protein